MAAIPTNGWLTAQPAHFRRALQIRLGIPLREVASGDIVCPCGATIDPCGLHYGACKKGNRLGSWSWRHDVLEAGLIAATKALHVRAHRINSNLLGEGAVTSARGNYIRPDVCLPSYYAINSHLFLDVAIADPCSTTALTAASPSSDHTGAASEAKAARKVAKYNALCIGAGSKIHPSCN